MKFDKRNKHRRRGGESSAPGSFFGPADPDVFFGSGRNGKPDYHTQALCKQVQRALTYILGGEVSDPVVQGLMVMDVTPAPNAGRLAVTLASRAAFDLADVLGRLEALRGFVRTRVAESITRKRAPELTFVVIPFGAIAPPPGEAGHG